MRLELPHLEDMAQAKIVRVCLTEGSTAAGRGIAVLSDNNPLARRPVSNLRWDVGVLTFDIACEGRNAARGSTRFRLAPESVRGRIAMYMGGKNMTMMEVYEGRRVGACDASRTWAL